MADTEKNYALMPLGEILLDLGYISGDQWEAALREADKQHEDFQAVLLTQGLIDRGQVTHALALQNSMRFWDADRIHKIVRKHRLQRVAPSGEAPQVRHAVWTREGGPILVVVSDLSDATVRSKLKTVYDTGRVEVVAVTPNTLTQVALEYPLPDEIAPAPAPRRSATTAMLDHPADVATSAAATLPPDAGEDAAPGTQVDHYTIVKRLAAGAAGVVYVAEDVETGNQVALKRLHPELAANARSVEQITTEQKILQRFDHPSIITVYDGGLWGGVPYFAMELLPGNALSDWIEGDERLSVPRIMRLWCQIADALAYAHRMGILHRDIKPQNVLLTDTEDVRVVDFGIARSTGDGGFAADTGSAAGTLLYMAPEQLRGRALTPATDVYALGMLAFQLLTGELLDGGLDLQVMLRRRQQRDVSFDDVRRPLTQALQRRGQMNEVGASLTEFARLLHHCLQKDPRDRCRSAEEVARRLRQLLSLRGWPTPEDVPLPDERPHAWTSGDDTVTSAPTEEYGAATAEMVIRADGTGEPETRIPDDYEVIKKLGKGSMGEVFLARDRDTGRQVALKLIAPEMAANQRFRNRFQREAEVLGRLRHPSVVHIFGVQFEGAAPHIAMEYIEGRDLEEVLRERQRLTVQESVPIITQVADALEHVHDAGIIHRDLKPSNLMITHDGQVKILDFGVAKDSEGADLTHTGAVIGTPHYMSPEQAAGQQASPLSDMYALGMIWWQLLVGSVPFRGSIPEVLHMHIAIQPPHVSERVEIPDSLDRLIARMLRKSASDRPQSFQDVIRIGAEAVSPPSALGRLWTNILAPLTLILGGGGALAYGYRTARIDSTFEVPISLVAQACLWGGAAALFLGALNVIWRLLPSRDAG